MKYKRLFKIIMIINAPEAQKIPVKCSNHVYLAQLLNRVVITCFSSVKRVIFFHDNTNELLVGL